MKMTTFKLLSAATALCLGGQAIAAPLVIDDFTTAQVALDNTSNGISVFSNMLDAGVLGGVRQFEAKKLSGGGAAINVGDISDGGPGGSNRFVYDQGGSNAKGEGWIRYDQVQNDTLEPTGFTPAVDLTQGGTLANFTFVGTEVVGQNVLSNLVLTVKLFDKTSGLASTQTVVLNLGVLGDVHLPYAAFSTPATASNVGAIEIYINGTGANSQGADVSFDLLASTPVPEPTSMAALGAAGFGLLRRRRA